MCKDTDCFDVLGCLPVRTWTKCRYRNLRTKEDTDTDKNQHFYRRSLIIYRYMRYLSVSLPSPSVVSYHRIFKHRNQTSCFLPSATPMRSRMTPLSQLLPYIASCIRRKLALHSFVPSLHLPAFPGQTPFILLPTPLHTEPHPLPILSDRSDFFETGCPKIQRVLDIHPTDAIIRTRTIKECGDPRETLSITQLHSRSFPLHMYHPLDTTISAMPPVQCTFTLISASASVPPHLRFPF